jgi:hypothetical protein
LGQFDLTVTSRKLAISKGYYSLALAPDMLCQERMRTTTGWNKKLIGIGACALALAFGAGACGDDDKDDAPADGSPSDGEQSDGSPSDGEQSDGEQSDGEQSDGSDGEPADGSDGDPADGSDGEVSEEVTACVAESIPGEPEMERFTFTGDDGLSVGFVRRIDPDSAGTSGTRIWVAERVAVTDQGGSACISDAEQLSYMISHHNFDDEIVAIAADVTYELSQQQEGYDFPVFFGITKKVGGTVAYGPTPLRLVKCTILNDDSDCTERYSR